MYNYEAGMAIEHFTNPYVAYQNVVQSYTTRKLRFESDILKAFAGIANVLGQKMDTRLIYGLPESTLIAALSWYIRGENSEAIGRRVNFPSWSWCGWASAVVVPPPATQVSPSGRRAQCTRLSINSGEKRLQLKTILFRMYIGESCAEDVVPHSGSMFHWVSAKALTENSAVEFNFMLIERR